MAGWAVVADRRAATTGTSCTLGSRLICGTLQHSQSQAVVANAVNQECTEPLTVILACFHLAD